uniref:Uncharacterized protein n=1 Tax=Oryza brachyantha TaxID=4533 RepID=J3LM67_ORYBR
MKVAMCLPTVLSCIHAPGTVQYKNERIHSHTATQCPPARALLDLSSTGVYLISICL